ncbi:hypothetical protein FACS18949_11880 [Clostridia bacterium]|nr:hypothetical protein FACS18949_11880 [Clostridia bacterium]
MTNRIYAQKNGELTKADMLEMSKYFVKVGYWVHIGREKPDPGKSKYDYFIEFDDGRKSI